LKRLLGLLILILSACSAPLPPVGTPTAFISSPLAQPVTITASPFPEYTGTPTPYLTPTANWTQFLVTLDALKTQVAAAGAASTITLTTTPTLTSTPFDPALIVTRASAAPAQCPPENPALVFDLSKIPEDYLYLSPFILEFLNAGGTRRAVIAGFKNYRDDKPQEVDLTGDGVPELITVSSKLSVFQCMSGQYQIIFEAADEANLPIPPSLVTIKDLNADGLPELVIGSNHYLARAVTFIRVVEWDGNGFHDLLPEKEYSFQSDRTNLVYSWYGDYFIFWMIFPKIEFKDLDRNGTKEIIVSGHVNMWYECRYGPWRDKSLVYSWNGKIFDLTGLELTPPRYRFQAVQDADRAALMGNYARALDLYQQVISSDQLEVWSPTDFIKQDWSCRLDRKKWSTPTPFPIDFHEYPNLAAYARYRMMLLHTVMGQAKTAQVDYDLLVNAYPDGKDGSIYADMASAFWKNYQASKNIQSACGQTIKFAGDNPYKVFYYLGNNPDKEEYWHGHNSHEYLPEDVCSFK
jgi:hypothetical protein